MITCKAYEFRRDVDRGLYWQPDAVSRAHGLYTGSDDYSPDTKVQVECYLLDPDIPMPEIANWQGLSVETLAAYHDLFFDARPAFAEGRVGWLGAQVFRNGLYSHVSGRDYVGQMHRIAWLMGGKVVKAFLSGGRFGSRNDDVKMAVMENIRDYTLKLTQLNVMCMKGQGEGSIEVLRIMLDDANKAVADKVAAQAGTSHGEEILRFLRSVSVAVADPTDKRNLELPAREPRAADYLKATEPVPV